MNLHFPGIPRIRPKKNSGYKNLIAVQAVIIATAVFVFSAPFYFSQANDRQDEINPGDVVINEVMWMGSSAESSDEWIELKNTTKHSVSLSDCLVTKNNGTAIVKATDLNNVVIDSEKFLVISRKSVEESAINVPSLPILSYQALSDTELKISLVCDSKIIDEAGNGKKPLAGEKGTTKKSMERNADPGDGTKIESWHTCESSECTSGKFWKTAGGSNYGTPGAANSVPVEPDNDESDSSPDGSDAPSFQYSSRIIINELLPDPEGDEAENEYIELFNSGEEPVNLNHWMLRDASKTGKFVFSKNHIIHPHGYLAVYRKEFGFALNNSGEETVALFDPDGVVVSTVTYSGAKEGLSYNFNGSAWRWSKFLTPGKPNQFNNLPDIEIDYPKKAFKDVYVDFWISASDPDNDEVKVRWDFGDGRRSYKAQTRHKYAETGTYFGSVTVSDGSEEITEKFTVEVKKYPRPKVRIVSLMPNPEGLDGENEWIAIQNKSKKTVDLADWSVATGSSSEKMSNHPIRDEFIIKPGKTVSLTRDISRFSLNNKKARIELRYPDGKVAHSVKYDYTAGKSIPEGLLYEKTEDGWAWREEFPVENEEIEWADEADPDDSVTDEDRTENETEPMANTYAGYVAPDLPDGIQGSYSFDESENRKGDFLKNHPMKISFTEKESVRGARSVRLDENHYIFTSPVPAGEHYAKKFVKKISSEANAKLNRWIHRKTSTSEKR